MKNNNLVIIDYGLGNLFNLKRALDYLGINCIISKDSEEILSASKLILPGVGAFGAGMKGLVSNGLIPVLEKYVTTGKPLLGICLGMQLLMESSEEYGYNRGLGFVKGEVLSFKSKVDNLIKYKVPQIGWNRLEPANKNKSFWHKTILSDIGNSNIDQSYMYFIHSFYVKVGDSKDTLANSNYAEQTYCSVLKKDQIYGVQFHPELSGELGLKILKAYDKLDK